MEYEETDIGEAALPPAPTNFRIYDSTTTSLSLAWDTVSTANLYSVEVFHASTGALIWSRYGIAGGSVYVSGLTTGVTYNIKLFANNNDGNSTPVWMNGVKVGNVRPSNWAWSITKLKGRSYNISNARVTNLVTLEEITGFQNRINDFRRYKSLPNYSFSSVARGQVYTTAMSNQLKAAINGMSPPTSTGTSTNVIDNLNRLRDSLNSIQ